MIDRTELLELIGPLGIDADGWAEEMADRILALDRRPLINLPEDDAKLILLALNAYRHTSGVRFADRSARIDALTARIIWREQAVDPVTYWHDIQKAGRRP